jgi:hypothetical protein
MVVKAPAWPAGARPRLEPVDRRPQPGSQERFLAHDNLDLVAGLAGTAYMPAPRSCK